MTDTCQLTFRLQSPDSSADELAELAQRLRNELLDLSEVQEAHFAADGVSGGTKSAAALDWNAVILTLIAAGGVAPTAITAAVTLMQAWLKRHEGHNITLEFSNGSTLTATNLSPEERRRLVDALLDDVRGFTPRSS